MIKVMKIITDTPTYPYKVYCNRIDKPCPGLLELVNGILSDIREGGIGKLTVTMEDMEEEEYEANTKI